MKSHSEIDTKDIYRCLLSVDLVTSVIRDCVVAARDEFVAKIRH